MPDIIKLHDAAVKAMAELIAARIVENANDNGEDPLTYATCTEIVEMYAGDIAPDISMALPDQVKKVVDLLTK